METTLVVAVFAIVLGLLLWHEAASLLDRKTATPRKWLGRCSALFLLVFISWGALATIGNAIHLSRNGTPAVATIKFKERRKSSYRSLRTSYVYQIAFDGHRVERSFHDPIESDQLTILYDPSKPRRFVIGDKDAPLLKILRSDLRDQFYTVYLWPVLIFVSGLAVYFSWRHHPAPTTTSVRQTGRRGAKATKAETE